MGTQGHTHGGYRHLHHHRPRPRREPLGTARRSQLNLITNPIHNGSTSTLSDVEGVPIDEHKPSNDPHIESGAASKQQGSETTLKATGSDKGPEASDAAVPTVRPRHEASELELFFDLFYVANLTTFTSQHKIEDRQSACPLRYSSLTCIVSSC